MKRLIFIALLLCAFLSSCKKDETLNLKQFPQTWQLVKTTGQIPDSESTGSDLEWQEFYILSPDGTFTKTREHNGALKQASGTFTYEVLPDVKYLILTYKTESNLIGTCNPEYQSEVMVIVSSTYMKGTWNACDGPGLEYSRVE